MTAYDFTVKNQEGNDISLSDYKGKVLMIVNTATECGFTPQYEDLQNLYDEYHNSGLEILDFPCDQFGNQAPGSNEEIHTFCTGRFGIEFPQFAKVDVNGENAIPLFQWLTRNTTFNGFGKSPMALIMNNVSKKADKNYKSNGNIKWNFTKFLIDKNGNIAERFEPTASFKAIESRLKELL